MGKKSKPKTPKAPDPMQSAKAQMKINKQAIKQSSLFNRYGQETPWGSTEWTNPGNPWLAKQRITMSPEEQAKLDRENAIAQSLGSQGMGIAGGLNFSPYSYEGISGVDPVNEDAARRVEQSTYDRAMGLLTPEYERQQKSLESRLATQGLPMGSEAYTEEMDRFGRGRREAELAAALDAVGAGRQEQSRMYGIQAANRAREIGEMNQGRMQPVSELAAIMGLTPDVRMPTPTQTAQYQMNPADLMGAQALNYQGQLNNYSQKMANQQAKKGGQTDLATTAMMAAAMGSDRRIKENIRKIGRYKDYNLYSYNYIGDDKPQIGVMADEVKLVNPDAVTTMDNGFDAVYYSRL